MNCDQCKSTLGEEHYTQPQPKGKVRTICSNCYQRLQQPPRLGTFQAFLRTLLFGGLAAMVCGFLAALPIVIINTDFAIVWIVLAVGIGMAVKAGSEDRGNWYYRLVALGSTWCAISLSWIFVLLIWSVVGFPDLKDDGSGGNSGPASKTALVTGLLNKPGQASPTPTPAVSATPTPNASATPAPGQPATGEHKMPALGYLIIVLLVVLVILGGPILIMMTSPISILIYGIALHTAWTSSARDSREYQKVGPAG
jgi:hypothetical protein